MRLRRLLALFIIRHLECWAVPARLMKLADVAMVIHGTALTNAVLERKLSKTALITTAGFLRLS